MISKCSPGANPICSTKSCGWQGNEPEEAGNQLLSTMPPPPSRSKPGTSSILPVKSQCTMPPPQAGGNWRWPSSCNLPRKASPLPKARMSPSQKPHPMFRASLPQASAALLRSTASTEEFGVIFEYRCCHRDPVLLAQYRIIRWSSNTAVVQLSIYGSSLSS